MVRKKKDPDHPSDDEDENDIESDPFGLGDEFYEMLNEQMRKIFSAIPGMFPDSFNLTPDSLKKMYADIFKHMNIDPRQLKNMNPEDLQRMMKSGKFGMRGPFVFGMNMGIGPDGKPIVNSFGNVKPRAEGETEIKKERDPLVDIYEEDDELIVVVEVPGVDKKEIELRSSKYELEIIANGSEHDSHQRKYHKVISLPAEINPDVAHARYKNGILEVRLQIVDKPTDKRKINIE